MTGISRKILIFLTGLLSSFHALAQAGAMREAVIISKVDTPMTQSVTLTFKKNYYNLLEDKYECPIDKNNIFSAKLQLQQPTIVLLRYRDKTMRLYIAPGDTLWMRFNGNEPDKTLSFSGTNNAPYQNRYLHEALLRFPDWVNENIVNDLLETKTPDEYHKILDEVYRRKKEFLDTYSEQEKTYFSPEFLAFANNEIEYWWAYQLLRYFDKYGLDNPKADRKLNDSYFDYLSEISHISAKSLHNEMYLNFLDLYLKYEQAKRNAGKPKLPEFEEKKAVLVRVVKPKDRTVRVYEEPYLTTPPVVTYISMGEEAIHLQLTTYEKFKYYDADKTFDCVFYKVKTASGRVGWVPEALMTLEDRTEVQVIKRSRLCFDEASASCGFETLLNGKVLKYVVAKDILFGIPYEKREDLQKKVEIFNKNNIYPEFTELLNTALNVSEKPQTIDKITIVANCTAISLEGYNADYVAYKTNSVKSSLESNKLAIQQGATNASLTATKLPAQRPDMSTVRPDEDKTQTAQLPQLTTETKPTVIPPAETRSTPTETKVEPKATPSVTVVPPAETRPTALKVEPKVTELKTDSMAVATKTEIKVEPKAMELKPDSVALATKIEVKVKPKVTELKPDSVALATKTEVKVEPKITELKPDSVVSVAKTEVKVEPKVTQLKPDSVALATKTEVKVEPKVMELKTDSVALVAKTETPPSVTANTNTNTATSGGSTELVSAPPPYLPPMSGDSWETFKVPDNYKPAPLPTEAPKKKGEDVGLVSDSDAPLMDFQSENGNLIKMSEFVKQGKFIVVDFWASWCTSCISDIEQQYKTNFLEQYKDKNVVFLYISTEKEEGRWKNYIFSRGWTQGVHVWDMANMAGMEYGATQLPLKYIITPNGKVAYNSLRDPNTTLVQCLDTLLQNAKAKQ